VVPGRLNLISRDYGSEQFDVQPPGGARIRMVFDGWKTQISWACDLRHRFGIYDCMGGLYHAQSRVGIPQNQL
jgi:hypothetical protein